MLRNSCTNCHLPYILNREALQIALDEVEKEGYKHYNVYCNNCGRPNKVSRKQLLSSAPWWKGSVKKSKSATAKSPNAGKSATTTKTKTVTKATKVASTKTASKTTASRTKSATKASNKKSPAKKKAS